MIKIPLIDGKILMLDKKIIAYGENTTKAFVEDGKLYLQNAKVENGTLYLYGAKVIDNTLYL